jgi:hypothetical protein
MVVVACRQLVGIGDQPPGAGIEDAGVDTGSEASTCGGFAWVASGCTPCMEGACCAPMAACRGDAICASTMDCLARCPGNDDLCRSACAIRGDDVMAAVATCQATSCASDCNLECGGLFGLDLFWFAQGSGECQRCETSDPSCSAFATLSKNASFVANTLCLDNCRPYDQVCLFNCDSTDTVDWPEGGIALIQGAAGACAAACPTPSWTCLGSVGWPSATSPSVTARFKVSDYETGKGVPDVSVRACGQLDTECATALGTGTVDAGGVVTLTVVAPFGGYVELSAPGYVTGLWFSYPSRTASSLSSEPGNVPSVGLVSAKLFASFPATQTAGLGSILAIPLDCFGQPATGVSFASASLGSMAQAWYAVNDVPALGYTATQPGRLVAGGFFDVTPGIVSVSALESGTMFASVTVPVRENAITIVSPLVPTP